MTNEIYSTPEHETNNDSAYEKILYSGLQALKPLYGSWQGLEKSL